ncbi:hypothetical protein P3X46_033868 [Hevea brasiliensis]|uniref:PPM-type phosphatase domain-containing protein n=1 Tax=Hevea brasiliensis TaxID=3981 RepID=A0ABQ9KCG3_HEVBR|nr:probable protein phosphatase 2C 74 [Hevea brasiliensis]KAJ9129347.1 hypothetical protein P3X46_033868 [Hevea brasiliensis]
MIHLEDFLRGFSIISLFIYFLQSLRKAISMASLCLSSPSSSSSSLPSPPPPPPLSWITSQLVLDRGEDRSFQDSLISTTCQEDDIVSEDVNLLRDHETQMEEKSMQENQHFEAYQKGLHDRYSSPGVDPAGGPVGKELDSLVMEKDAAENNSKGTTKLKKRPARLVLPEYYPKLEFGEKDRKLENMEFEDKGRDFCLASKKGRRQVMEDGYGIMTDILGDAKQAFFAVIDGHGGRAAADYVAENLGKNIVKALENVGKDEDDDHHQPLEQAIRQGYLVTDREFLSQQGVSSGACVASALLKDGELHVANVGDCRVVLSRKGVADTLTVDHRLSREDEKLRIENSGGFVHCRNGIWRVQGSLAISRAIGDLHLKDWVISDPEIKCLPLTSDCEFLIMASDGLWDKVNEQEAVDVVLRDGNSVESCKKLIDMSFGRGNMDDITVMVINLHNFLPN